MNNLDKESVIGISALLVHAAHIDEIYTKHERDLILEFIKSYLSDVNADDILKKAENIEKNSNQLLNYTNIIKKTRAQRWYKEDLFARFHVLSDTGYIKHII